MSKLYIKNGQHICCPKCKGTLGNLRIVTEKEVADFYGETGEHINVLGNDCCRSSD